MGEPRGGVDCSSGDEGHLFIACLTIAKIRRANVGPNEQGLVDALNTQMLSLTQSGWPLSSSERDLETQST
jgi:hypothetical protein